MTESAESREYVAWWLKQVPAFMAELGIEDAPDLAARLQYLGSGGRADAVIVPGPDGRHRVFKVTNDPAQGVLSQAALEDEPVGVVPIYDVVETELDARVTYQTGRPRLGELPRKGEEVRASEKTWGIVEKLVLPVDALVEVGLSVDGVPPLALVMQFDEALKAYRAGSRSHHDPLVEDWRLQIAAAVEWIQETCDALGTQDVLDFHEGNFGVDPDTGELVLIDLGQCYAP
jgi:hypothetical protein